MKVSPKIRTVEELAPLLADIRKEGRKIVFTNGCFDLLHAGHVRYLEAAKSVGDILVVGLNSDESVKIIKGAKRPIVKQAYRAEVLAGLGCIDFVTVFNEPDPLQTIHALRPDILVKGEDWEEKEIIGADFVKKHGGSVVRIPLAPEISTSGIIQRILKYYA
jgi:D-beta-D-heptose 7-phosphate kinase/D-beta-D-heptose 1-phosphate adenosyltransferase